jgi:PKD domain-containing protein
VDVAPGLVAGGTPSRVGFDARGDAIFLLDSTTSLQAVIRPAGGPFDAPVHVSARGRYAVDAQLAVNDEGDAAAVWAYNDGDTVYGAVRPAGGEFEPSGGAALGIRTSLVRAGPVVGLDARGDTTAVWATGSFPNNFSVQAATRPASGSWSSPQTISTANTQPIGVALAVDPKGNAIAAWTYVKEMGLGLAAAFRPAGGGWEAPREVASAANYGVPQVALAASGEGIVVWSCCLSPSRVEAATFSVDSRMWSPPEDVSPPGVAAEDPQLALDGNGNALVVWTTPPSLGLQAATRPRGGRFGAPRALAPSATSVQLAMNVRGDAIVVWQRGPFLSSDLQARVRPAGGGLTRPATMWGSLQAPGAAVDDQGDAVVLWTPAGGGVDAAVYDEAGPQLRSLRVPAKGEAGARLRFAVSPLDVWSSVASTRWSFGDGSQATGAAATHAYRRSGRYAITLTSTDSLGHATTMTRRIRIAHSGR